MCDLPSQLVLSCLGILDRRKTESFANVIDDGRRGVSLVVCTRDGAIERTCTSPVLPGNRYKGLMRRRPTDARVVRRDRSIWIWVKVQGVLLSQLRSAGFS